MTVYVDDGRRPYRGMLMAHMLADTPEELHAMADRIGIGRRWYQASASTPHYDVCRAKRALALAAGAVAADRRGIVEVVRRIRADPGRWTAAGGGVAAASAAAYHPDPRALTLP